MTRQKQFTDEYSLHRFQMIKPRNRDFMLLVAPRLAEHYRQNLHEEFTADLLLGLLSDDAVFVDVGAHYGYYTILAGTRYTRCRTIAFEPVPENFEVLTRNTAFNGLSGAELHNVAVSDEDGIRSFKIARASDMCSFHDHPLVSTRKDIQVQTVRLDHFLRDLPTRSSTVVVKIDVEGHEYRVLSGMRDFLRSGADVKLIMELNPACLRRAGCAPTEMIAEIHNLGFGVRVIDEDKQLLHQVHADSREALSVYLDGKDESWYTNLLCTNQRDWARPYMRTSD